MNNPLVTVTNLNKQYTQNKNFFNKLKTNAYAVKDLNLTLYEGEVFGLVGESGSGKSTLGKSILQLIKPTTGSVVFQDVELTKMSQEMLRKTRKKLQYIFQDPKSCLNPNKTIGWILEEPLLVHGLKDKEKRKKLVNEMLEMAGLSTSYLKRYPHELSGGQAQRVVILSALILKPKFVVADEAVSSLDVSIQAQILNFLNECKEKLNLTILFITHDLAVCHYMSDRIGVMYLGYILEIGNSNDIYNNPLHPYTQMLFSSVIKVNDEIKQENSIIISDVQNQEKSIGCPYVNRCNFKLKKCEEEVPDLFNVKRFENNLKMIESQVRCFLYENN